MVESRDSSPAMTIAKWYENTRRSAKVLTRVGIVIRVLSVIISALIIIPSILALSEPKFSSDLLHAGLQPGTVFVVGITSGPLSGIGLFLLGLIVSAQGKVLEASLGAAVNSSPFITNEYKAQILSS